jgi:OFA family oxalate/formate antiporter-like MFS transporter
MMPRVGPRKLAVSGGIVLGLGSVLAGLLGSTSFPVLFICIGIIGGSGIGLAYVVPIAVGMRWFPDKKGMITGLAVAGFGFGAMLWVKLAGTWGHLIANLGLGTTFMVYGIAFFATVVVGGIWMVFPPEGWKPAGWTGDTAKSGTAGNAVIDLESGPMLRTPQFYMIFVTFLFSASAGLMSIGLMKLFPGQALESNGFSPEEASAIAGTAMAVFFSLANGLGRIGWGTISDKIGRKPSIFLMTALQGVMMLVFPLMAGTPALLYLGATLVGFNFGGNFALFPTITADTFGAKFVGQNYGWVFLAYGVGGIFGPIMGGRLGDMGNFPMAFTIVGVLCLAAAVIIALVKRPKSAVSAQPSQAAA